MRINTAFSSALLFSTMSVMAIDTDADKFFRTNPDPGKGLPPDQVYPKGQIFPFTFYSVGGGSEAKRGDLLPQAQKEADQKKIVDGGATMIGPQYELNDAVVADAKRLKVKAVYSIFPQIDGRKVDREYLKNLDKERKPLDVEKLRKSVVDIVKREAANPEIAWWDITPEELRFWMKTDMLCLKTVCEAVREADPQKRPLFMYEPGHRDAKSLSKTVVFQDLCAKGMYTNYSSQKNSRAYCRWSIEQEVEGIKMSGNTGAVPVALPEMFVQPAENELGLIESWVRHDVYSALIAGAKGVLVFSASRRPDFSAREKYLDAYLKVCRELTGPMNLGRIFLFGERRDDITASVIEGPETVELKVGKDNELKLGNKNADVPSIGMANMAYENSRYVFIANSSEAEVGVVVSGLVYGKGVTVRDVFNADNSFAVPEGDFTVSLRPLEVKAFKIWNAK